MCLQCHWLETKAKKQMSSVLTSKAEEIRQYRIENASFTQKLELILPGMGSFAANKIFKGVMRLTAFSVGLILIATGGEKGRSPLRPANRPAYAGASALF